MCLQLGFSDSYHRTRSISESISNKVRPQQKEKLPMIGHSDACHIDMSRFKYNLSPTSLSSINTYENAKKPNIEETSNCPSTSIQSTFKDSERSKVHFCNSGSIPEKDDIISLYGTPKEEMGVNTDGYDEEDGDDLSHQGKKHHKT